MRNFFILFLFFCGFTFSQTAKDFLVNDNEKLFKSPLINVISESKKYGYNLERNNEGDFIFYDGIKKFFYLTKKIKGANEEGFPEYSISNICKKYYFMEKTLEDATAWKIETEVSLLEYQLVNNFQIDKCFRGIKNEIISNNSNHNYVTTNTINKLNFESLWGHYYDIIEENSIEKPCPGTENKEVKDCVIEHLYSNGVFFEQKISDNGNIMKFHYITFILKDKDTSELLENINTIVSRSNNSFDNIRFTIGSQDMRKINQYDLEAMVKFFLEDCKKSNKKVPEINTLKATFEPLEGSVIALAYGYGDDTTIVIKVDPEKWANSSIEKRWYVLYHELGHDVLNLEHGQGGKMMFNFADKEYTWDDFFNDKEYMINFNKN